MVNVSLCLCFLRTAARTWSEEQKTENHEIGVTNPRLNNHRWLSCCTHTTTNTAWRRTLLLFLLLLLLLLLPLTQSARWCRPSPGRLRGILCSLFSCLYVSGFVRSGSTHHLWSTHRDELQLTSDPTRPNIPTHQPSNKNFHKQLLTGLRDFRLSNVEICSLNRDNSYLCLNQYLELKSSSDSSSLSWGSPSSPTPEDTQTRHCGDLIPSSFKGGWRKHCEAVGRSLT